MHNNILDNWIYNFSILKRRKEVAIQERNEEIMKIMFISILISIESFSSK